MNPNNDPSLAVLLNGVTDPAQREAIITAYAALHSAGATTFPGALAVILARHTAIVVDAVNKVTPSGPLEKNLENVAEEFRVYREDVMPALADKWNTVVVAVNGIRKFRLGGVFSYILIALLVGYVGGFFSGGYAGYELFFPKPTQLAKIETGTVLENQHITLYPEIRSDGSFLLTVAGDRPFTIKQDYSNADGVVGERILWPAPFPLQ
jgi:hypothetical protein